MLGFQVITSQRHVLETETLSKFWTPSRQSLVRTSGQVFIKALVRVCQGNSKKVKKRAANFLESLETPSEHAGARRYKDQRLDATLKQNFWSRTKQWCRISRCMISGCDKSCHHLMLTTTFWVFIQRIFTTCTPTALGRQNFVQKYSKPMRCFYFSLNHADKIQLSRC